MCIFAAAAAAAKSLQSHPILSDPMDCSLPGSSVHGIFQARVLEGVAIAFSGALFRLKKIQNMVHITSCTCNAFVSNVLLVHLM